MLGLLGPLVLSLASPPVAPASRGALLYIDAVDFERRILLDMCAARGIDCVQIWSPPYARVLVAQGLLSEEAAEAACAPAAGEEEAWAASRDDLATAHLLGVLCGSDAGLATAERLQHTLVPQRSNGVNVARRDKFAMHEAVRAAGLAAAAQCAPSSWAEASAFLATLGTPLRAVLKPIRGQDSLRVGLASSLPQARAMYEALSEVAVSLDDELPPRALVQELLDGDEWVIDTVSRDGEHKALALWRCESCSSRTLAHPTASHLPPPSSHLPIEL
jgi:biotin carboxylase